MKPVSTTQGKSGVGAAKRARLKEGVHIERSPRRVRTYFDNQLLADSEQVLLVYETKRPARLLVPDRGRAHGSAGHEGARCRQQAISADELGRRDVIFEPDGSPNLWRALDLRTLAFWSRILPMPRKVAWHSHEPNLASGAERPSGRCPAASRGRLVPGNFFGVTVWMLDEDLVLNHSLGLLAISCLRHLRSLSRTVICDFYQCVVVVHDLSGTNS